MHTTTARRTPGAEVCIIHNGDWSGEVLIRWRTGPEPDDYAEVELPADVLLCAMAASASDALRSAVISAVENWELSIDEQSKRRLGL